MFVSTSQDISPFQDLPGNVFDHFRLRWARRSAMPPRRVIESRNRAVTGRERLLAISIFLPNTFFPPRGPQSQSRFSGGHECYITDVDLVTFDLSECETA